MPNLSDINFFFLRSFRINFCFAVCCGFQNSFMLQFLSWIKFAFKIIFVGIILPLVYVFVLSVGQKDEAGQLWAFLTVLPLVSLLFLHFPINPGNALWETFSLPPETARSWDFTSRCTEVKFWMLNEPSKIERGGKKPVRKLRKGRGYFLCTCLVLIKICSVESSSVRA